MKLTVIVTVIALVLLILISMAGLTAFFAGSSRMGKETAKQLPWLQVDGKDIVGEAGTLVILQGVAIEDPSMSTHLFRERSIVGWMLSLLNMQHLAIGNKLEQDFKELKENWNVTVVRLPVHPGAWKQDKAYAQRYIDPVVALAKKYGIYVLLGWHAHGNPLTGEVEEVELSPFFKGHPYDPDYALAAQFWGETAYRYRNDSEVIYSIFNEPAFISWDEWKPVAEQLVDVVRLHNPRALILVSGVEWGYDLREAGMNPLQREHIVYEVHPYPGQAAQHGPWENYFGYLAEEYPVFVGEWGFEPSSGNENLRATSEDYGKLLLKYMNSGGMSWTAWAWSPVWEPRMPQNWEYEPTEFGMLVKGELGEKYHQGKGT